MARITVRAVVDIIPDFSVLFVHLRLFVSVASRAGENSKVRRVDVAIVAGRPPVFVRSGIDRECVVDKRRTHPCRRVVALGTVGWKTRRQVIGIGDAGVFALMAGVAVRRRPRVPAPDMATGAGSRYVRTGECEARLTVVKACRSPNGSAVTHLALLRKACGFVVRIGGAVVVRQVA